MALKDYTLKFSDNTITGKSDISVTENTINDYSTSLTLYGYGHTNYGTGLWQNMLHIMENFASSSTAPAHPTIGQLWYHSGRKSLLIYVGTDDTASNNGWKNIVSNYDFSNTVSGANAVVQYLTKSDLVGYLTPEVTQQLTGNLVLKNNDTWFTTDSNGVVKLDSSANIPGNYAASVRYVNVKVDTVVSERITALGGGTSNVSAESVNTSLVDYDNTGTPVGVNHLYIRRAKNSPEESRTMHDNLILPAQTTAVIAGDDNYAATKGFVRAVLGSSKNIITSTDTITAATGNDVITGTTSYLPLKGGTLTGNLYLITDESGYTDTNKNRAASRAYVDSKLGSGSPTGIISPANKDFSDNEKLNNKDRELISYTKLPDGTLIVYGYYRKFGVSYKADGRYASSLTKILFPDGIKFTNNYYAVSITEEVPTVTMSPFTATSSKKTETPFTYKSCDNLRRSGLWKDFNTKYYGFYKFRGAEILNSDSSLDLTYPITKYNHPVSENYNYANTSAWDVEWKRESTETPSKDFTAVAPTTFSVFEKEVDGFRLSAYNDNGAGSGAGLTYLFWRNFIACNFTAIGRWK